MVIVLQIFQILIIVLISIVMRLGQDAIVIGVPGGNAIVHAHLYLGPQFSQPVRIAAYAPVAVNLDNTAQLAIRRRVETVRCWSNGQ